MIAKTHIAQGKLILAVCDDKILGQKFEEDDIVLDLTSNYYKGEKKGLLDILELIQKAYVVNAVGEKTIQLLTKNKIISEREVKKISGIPHAQIVFASD